ncbi:hypothetical protein ACFORL_03980 [Legionella dresdenensis]|uniref:Uncharacterized protein n=1 Tax=Legionella dresdenensis TaxID=450200 RepID=A0ABV8CD64_9GAMM
MTAIKTEDHTGYSDTSLQDALQEALNKAKEYNQLMVVETRSSQMANDKRQYQVTLTTYMK